MGKHSKIVSRVVYGSGHGYHLIHRIPKVMKNRHHPDTNFLPYCAVVLFGEYS